jgi:hypothetical protein
MGDSSGFSGRKIGIHLSSVFVALLLFQLYGKHDPWFFGGAFTEHSIEGVLFLQSILWKEDIQTNKMPKKRN